MALARPYIIVVLAMSADGKIADVQRSAARFPSAADKAHLERLVATSDATLFGAGTLRAYGTTLPVTNPDFMAARRQRRQTPQPIQIVCSASGKLESRWPFFQQPVPRWLLTTPSGEAAWLAKTSEMLTVQPLFDQRLVTAAPLDWSAVMHELQVPTGGGESGRSPIHHLTVMGGGELVAALLADALVDELHLTICPLLIGGNTAPTPVGGPGFTLPDTPRLRLLSARVESDEVFLHYSLT